MARSANNLKAVLEDTAAAIRAKKGSNALIVPRDFSDEIASIPTGVTPTVGDVVLTANGIYDPHTYGFDYFSSVAVNVTDPSAVTLDPPLTQSSGTPSIYLVATNANNGKFVNGLVYTINSSTTVTVNVSAVGSNTYALEWLFPYYNQAGGTQSVSVYEISNSGLAPSNAVTYNQSFPVATDTGDGSVGVANLGNSSPTAQTYEYDASANFPLTFPEVTDNYGNKFIRFPKMYRKVTADSNGQITGFRMATSKLDASYEIYPCFLDENGNELPYILVGKFCVSNTSTANSVDATASSLTMSAGRTLCRNRGTGYQMYDWMIQKLFVDLGLVISRRVNINQSWYIYGIMGIFHQQNYPWVDGVIKGSSDDATQWYVSYKPSEYQNAGGGTSTSTAVSESDIVNTLGYTKVGYTAPASNGWITKLGYDTNNPFFNYPNAATGGSGTTYYCDQYYQSSGARPVYAIVGAQSNDFGWWYCSASNEWGNGRSVRLCFRPVTGATGYTE